MKRLSVLMACAMLALSCGRALEGVEHEEVLFLRHAGADMPIWVRGNLSSGVIILVVHGGAGGNSASYVQDFKDTLEKDYAIAYWDQRHSGGAQGSLSVEDFNHTNAFALMATDMKLVIELLRVHYGQEMRVFAWGHSWGVQLGTKFLVDHDPGLLDGWLASNGSHSGTVEHAARHAYITTYAQMMRERGEPLSQPVSTAMGGVIQTPQDALSWVAANDPITTWDQAAVQWELGGVVGEWVLDKYTDPEYAPALPPGTLLLGSPASPIAQAINSARTGTLINNSSDETSIQEFWDLAPQLAQVELPVALLWGRYDPIIPQGVAHDYYERLGTPAAQKTLIFYDAGHSPEYEKPAQFARDVRLFIEANR